MATATAPVRRTQEERSSATRRALLDAAIECLIEKGYGAFSTTTVADRAGVSRGAQLHHFPTRASLVSAAVAHVFANLTADYERAFESLDAKDRSAARAVALLEAVCADRRHHAVLDLYAAARTDEELRASVVPVAARHRENIVRLAARYFPDAAGDANFLLTLDLLVHAMVGMAVARGLYGQDPAGPALATLIEKLATDAAGHCAAPASPKAGAKDARDANAAAAPRRRVAASRKAPANPGDAR